MKNDSRIELAHDVRDGCLVVRPTGTLDSLTYGRLRDCLVKLALEQPRAVIADLAELQIASDSGLTVFLAASDQVSEWPGVPILVAAGDLARHEHVAGTALPRFVPVYASVEAALAAAPGWPRRRLARADFSPVPDSSTMVRRLVRQICLDWDVTQQVDDAVQIASELTDNAIVHGGVEPLQVRLEYRRGLLTVAVRDSNPRPAVLREDPEGGLAGFGLLLVAELAKAWGCAPDLQGGKVVWAVLGGEGERLRSLPSWSVT